MRILVTTVLLLGIAALAVAGALLGQEDGRSAIAATGPEEDATPPAIETSASPTAPDATVPDWVLDEARWHARVLDDSHPDAAWWGLVTLGSLEELMENEWPDPSMRTYVIVLAGDFSMATTSHPVSAEVPAPDLGRARVAVFLYSAEGRSLSSFSLLLSGDAVAFLPTDLQPFSL